MSLKVITDIISMSIKTIFLVVGEGLEGKRHGEEYNPHERDTQLLKTNLINEKCKTHKLITFLSNEVNG